MLLPPGLPTGPPIEYPSIVARVRDYLAALARSRPLVLLLEDLHWADVASLDLLRVVARRLADLPVLLLGTYRGEDVGHGHPLFALLPLLVREARADRLDLQPLDRDAIGGLVAGRYALTAAEAIRLTDYLAGRTEGNALFLGEVGLGGEVRPVSQAERRLGEAARMGTRVAYLAERGVPRRVPDGMQAVGLRTVRELFERLFR